MLLELRGVSRRYQVGDQAVYALNQVDLQVDEGEFIAVRGPSGSGKSTLLNLIGLLDSPTTGHVILDGVDVSRLSDGERAWTRLTRLGFVFQQFHLVSLFTAVENVAMPMEAVGVPADERFARASTLLAQVGLADRLHFRPSRLSGGQRQRVAICRAVANRPRLLLADEPTGQLHTEDKRQVIDLLSRLNAQGATLIVVTHDADTASAARRILELRDGAIVREERR
ncbi:MAG: ABC transporter ATP-binding protein [Dehalococcoidia bacterium]|nr:ABC transporter ATP-binding protein [Dehalococcoidia bacterium]